MNTEEFIKRLEHVLEYYGLTASSFADKISVQRSSVSHLLSGRNKPSLDFILKVLEQFPEIDLLWFLNGVGVFPNTSKSQSLNSNEIKAENKNIITIAKKATNGKSQFLKSLETWKNIEI